MRNLAHNRALIAALILLLQVALLPRPGGGWCGLDGQHRACCCAPVEPEAQPAGGCCHAAPAPDATTPEVASDAADAPTAPEACSCAARAPLATAAQLPTQRDQDDGGPVAAPAAAPASIAPRGPTTATRIARAVPRARTGPPLQVWLQVFLI